MTDNATVPKKTTEAGKTVSHYTLLGYFKTPTIKPDGTVLERWTWRGDKVQKDFAAVNKRIDSQLSALLYKLLEVYEKLTTITIYDNTAVAPENVLLKVVKGIIVIDNLPDSEQVLFSKVREAIKNSQQ